MAWKATRGKIISSGMERVGTTVDEQGQEQELFRPEVEYEYEVGGQFYVGNRPTELETSSTRKNIEAFIAFYAVGSGATVYYNTDSPYESYLQKGGGILTGDMMPQPEASRAIVLAMAIALSLAIMGVAIAVMLAESG